MLTLIGLLAACAGSQRVVVLAQPAPEPLPAMVQQQQQEEQTASLRATFERVFFAFDSAEIVPAARDALDEAARILREYPAVQVRIEGHADERGTERYNLELGRRRAAAIEDALLAMGVSPDQVETVSYGEARPLSDRAGESAWAKDRRAEFRVQSDPDNLVQGTIGLPVDENAGVVDVGADAP